MKSKSQSLEQWKAEMCNKIMEANKREIGIKVQDDWKNIQEKIIQMWRENERRLDSFFPSIDTLSAEYQCEINTQKKLREQLKELKSQNAKLQQATKITNERTQRFVRLKKMELQNKNLADQILQYDQEIDTLEQSVMRYKKELSVMKEALKKKTSDIDELKLSLPSPEALENS